jgi:hypothetical protein
VRSAAADTSRAHVVVHRPGQVVALDTTPLPVKVRDGVFGDPVSAHLTLALDLYTHSIVAFRLTLVSDTSVDVAMPLRDVMMPLPAASGSASPSSTSSRHWKPGCWLGISQTRTHPSGAEGCGVGSPPEARPTGTPASRGARHGRQAHRRDGHL